MPVFKMRQRARKRGRPAFVRRVPKRDFSSARLIDDEFFKVCFDGNAEAAQLLVDRILRVPGLKVVSARVQEHLSSLGSKTVVLDLLAKTEEGEEVDIEVQRSSDPHQARRARYYLSAMTSRMLKEGEPYGKLRDAYVLFICEKDPFGKGRPVYSFAMRDRFSEDGDFLGDGSAICFFNCAYEGDDAFGKLAADMLSSEWRSIADPLLQSLSKRGKMYSEEADMSYRAEEEFDKGYLKGREKTREEDVAALLRDGALPPERIAEILGIPLADVLRIKKKIEA